MKVRWLDAGQLSAALQRVLSAVVRLLERASVRCATEMPAFLIGGLRWHLPVVVLSLGLPGVLLLCP